MPKKSKPAKVSAADRVAAAAKAVAAAGAKQGLKTGPSTTGRIMGFIKGGKATKAKQPQLRLRPAEKAPKTEPVESVTYGMGERREKKKKKPEAPFKMDKKHKMGNAGKAPKGKKQNGKKKKDPFAAENKARAEAYSGHPMMG